MVVQSILKYEIHFFDRSRENIRMISLILVVIAIKNNSILAVSCTMSRGVVIMTAFIMASSAPV